MTPLERGIIVKISPQELKFLREKTGFLDTENYPEEYLKLLHKNEVGRFMFFRFILES